MFKLLYHKFIQDIVYQILSELTGFCVRYEKTFWVFFGSQCVLLIHCWHIVGVVRYVTSFTRCMNWTTWLWLTSKIPTSWRMLSNYLCFPTQDCSRQKAPRPRLHLCFGVSLWCVVIYTVFQKSDAKIKITITTSNLITIKHPLSN